MSPQSLLANWPDLPGEFQASERPCVQNKQWGKPANSPRWLQEARAEVILCHPHIHVYTHMYTHTTQAYTKQFNNHASGRQMVSEEKKKAAQVPPAVVGAVLSESHRIC